MKVIRLTGPLMLMLSLAVSLLAHHSAAGVDTTKQVTHEGTVKKFNWANPHSYLEVEVINDKGVAEIWNLEMMPPSYLVKAGWKSSTLKFGDKVTFTARPMRNGDPGGLFVSAKVPDGRTLTQTAPRGGGAAPTAAPTPPVAGQR